MSPEAQDAQTGTDGATPRLDELRGSEAPPEEFWPAWLAEAARFCGADTAALALRAAPDAPWQRVATWRAPRTPVATLPADWEALATRAQTEGPRSATSAPDGDGVGALAVPLRLPGEEQAVALAALPAGRRDADEALLRLRLAAAVAEERRLGELVEQARADVAVFASVLDLVVLVNAEKRFMATAMTLCNQLAARHRCRRVALGWVKGPYVRVCAISHMERFEKKMAAVQGLETAMEEALDQDDEIVYPAEGERPTVNRDHGLYAREQGAGHVLSLPLRVDRRPVGVLTCERDGDAFTAAELRQLRLSLDAVARRLDDLERQDRWFGARWLRAARERAARLVGHEHTTAKLIGLAAAALLAFLVFGRMPYRVAAPFTLACDRVACLPAPYDGYIEAVHAPLGATVTNGEVLVTLDRRDLLLEEASALADRSRFLREAEKARAANKLADMRIAEARAAQAGARLDQVRRRLAQAELRTPTDGAVIEGDLKERVGSPVRQGELLMKVAQLDGLYAELEVPEADIESVRAGGRAQIAFASQPQWHFPVTIVRVDPMARPTEKGNAFRARCALPPDAPDWWRPGMSGVARVDAGRRRPIWILTHRTADFLRLRFWW